MLHQTCVCFNGDPSRGIGFDQKHEKEENLFCPLFQKQGVLQYAALIPPVDNNTDVHVQLAIVTAFSQNHKLEAIAMIGTLVAVEFTGDVYIYLMRRVGENPSWGDAVKDELYKSPLSLIFIDLEVTEEYSKYCFKPRAMANFYHRQFLLPEEDRVQVVMVSKLIYK